METMVTREIGERNMSTVIEVEDLVEKHSLINTSTKYAVKIAGKSHNLLLSGTISLIQDMVHYKAAHGNEK